MHPVLMLSLHPTDRLLWLVRLDPHGVHLKGADQKGVSLEGAKQSFVEPGAANLTEADPLGPDSGEATPARRRAEPRRMERFCLAALIACLIATFCLFAATAGAIVAFPYALDYGEGPIIDQAQRVAAGEQLYKATFDDPPYVVTNYPPLYVLAVAGMTRLMQLPLLSTGRAISLASALVAAGCVGLLASRLSGSRLAGIVAAALFLGHPFAMNWSALARVDFLALALSLLGLWLLLVRWHSWTWLVMIAGLATAAIFTKQTYALALPLAATIWLGHNDRRRAMVFVLLVACASFLLSGLLNWMTAGGFYLNVIVGNLNKLGLSWLARCVAVFLLNSPIAVAVAAVEMIYWLRRPQPGSRGSSLGADAESFRRWALLPYTLATVMSALVAAKRGSNVNYLLELVAAVAIWAAIGFAAQPLRKGAVSRSALTLVLLLQLLWTLFVAPSELGWLIGEWQNVAAYRVLSARVQRAALSGPVLADRHMELIVQAGQRLYLQPFELGLLSEEGRWDPSRLVAEVQAHKFPMIIVSAGQFEAAFYWPPEILEAIRTNYSATESLAGLTVYTPRGASR